MKQRLLLVENTGIVIMCTRSVMNRIMSLGLIVKGMPCKRVEVGQGDGCVGRQVLWNGGCCINCEGTAS